MSREQLLVDICFQVGLLMSNPKYDFVRMSEETKAEYIAKQLCDCGFDTTPCGSSWGLLK